MRLTRSAAAVLLGFVVAASLVGCAGGDEGSTPVPGTATLVTFGRQGGIAGTDDKMVIRNDGAYEAASNGKTATGQITDDELTKLRSVLESSDFADIPAVNPAGPVVDGFTYRVVYAGHEVVAQDGAIPPALDPVIGLLNELLGRYAPH